ncbi:MAG: N-acetylmuramoyl-L-alanine amidase [bacterium]|nr:N-acetylmuramoyl-L-alanine amidase [bacterium]
MIYPRLEPGQEQFSYPQELDSSFVLGQMVGATPSDRAFCNGHSLELASDGAFLAFLPLGNTPETSVWSFTLIIGGADTSRLNFSYCRTTDTPEPVWSEVSPPVWYQVCEPYAHTRTCVGGSYHLFPESGTPLKVVAVSEKWVRFALGGGVEGVIERRFVNTSSPAHVTGAGPVRLGNGLVTETDHAVTVVFQTTRTALWEVSTESDADEFQVLVYGGVATVDRIHFAGRSRDFVNDIRWGQLPQGVSLLIESAEDQRWNGYRASATDTTFTFTLWKLRESKPGLKGKHVVLDPGHGGSADGAIGPRGSKEKDIVLRWSQLLAEELKSAGAAVTLTRVSDTGLSLPERVEVGHNSGCDAFLSLHANALPDGQNPFARRGCGVYYYQTTSRRLAEAVQDEILSATKLADDGLYDANFAVVRPTDFPAILIEAAYLMRPDEEQLLMDESFLKRLSRGVVKGLQEYYSE